MSGQVSVSRNVAAPADVVWALVTDVTRMGEWSPETTSARWIKGAGGPAAGARFQGVNRNGSKQWKSVATITAAEPASRFEFRVTAGPLQIADWAYAIEPTPEGCRVTETWSDRRSRFTKVVSRRISGVEDRASHNRAGMTATLERLAAAAESAT